MKSKYSPRLTILIPFFFFLLIQRTKSVEDPTPTPTPWPLQFHSLLLIKINETGLQVVDLWYDWPNGRNLNLIQNQLGTLKYDVEWTNGTSFIFTDESCRLLNFSVGILRPNWLDGATYLGQQKIDGFLCNVWTKVDFIWYYEDVVTKRPVYWAFFNGMTTHVMTFEVGAVLEDSKWQAPSYCFGKTEMNVEDESGYGDGKLVRDM